MTEALAQTTEKKELAKKKSRVKAVAVRQVPRGNAYIHATYNNTIVSVADPDGNVLVWSTAGHKGFSGPKKATPYAAAQVIRDVANKIAPYGMREVFIYLKGVGGGRESAIRTLNAVGLQIVGIKDMTPIPHNGPRPPKPRRI